MNAFENLLIELKEYIQRLEVTFIHQFITNPTAKPDEYELQVKAYCVLCHAALEEYFEGIAREVMNQYLKEWAGSGKYTDPLIAFVSYHGEKFLDNVDKNQGASIKYLKKLLEPISIEITEHIKLSSLSTLASKRGEYAHKRGKRVLAPESARDYVCDCLELCEDVKTKAESKFI